MEFRRSNEKGYMFEKNEELRHGEGKVEVGTFLLGNDKNNVIAGKVLSHF